MIYFHGNTLKIPNFKHQNPNKSQYPNSNSVSHQSLTADCRPPTADRRPPTADRRPPTADR
jgi:hypothetical protein